MMTHWETAATLATQHQHDLRVAAQTRRAAGAAGRRRSRPRWIHRSR
jgi:hypothetical protein